MALSLSSYCVKRLIAGISTLILVMCLNIFLIQLALDTPSNASSILKALQNVFQLQFGTSWLYNNQAVTSIIVPPLVTSLLLTFITLFLANALSFLIAFKVGERFERRVDKAMLSLLALPNLLIGLIVVSCVLRLDSAFKLTSYNNQKELFYLAIFTLTLSFMPKKYFFYKTHIKAITDQRFYHFFATHGSSTYQRLRHALFPNLLPFIFRKLPGEISSLLFKNTLMVEVLFHIKGLGYTGYQAIMLQDSNLFIAVFFVYAFSTIMLSVIFDVLSFRNSY